MQRYYLSFLGIVLHVEQQVIYRTIYVVWNSLISVDLSIAAYRKQAGIERKVTLPSYSTDHLFTLRL